MAAKRVYAALTTEHGEYRIVREYGEYVVESNSRDGWMLRNTFGGLNGAKLGMADYARYDSNVAAYRAAQASR